MGENQEGAPPLTLEEAAKALSPDEGQEPTPATPEPAPPTKPEPVVDKGTETPPASEDAKSLGFESEADLAKAYSEQRTEKNRRDKELSAGRKAQEELGKYKGLLGLNETPPASETAGQSAPVTKPVSPTPVPPDTGIAPAEMASLRESLGDDVANNLSNMMDRRVEERVGKVEGQLQAEKKAERDRWLKGRLNTVQDGITELISTVGEAEYDRVMTNPDNEAAIAEMTIVQGLSPKAVFRAYREQLAIDRGGATESEPTGTSDGGALPPGGKPGGAQPQTKTTEETEAQEMAKALDEMNVDFFEKGKEG